MRMEQRQRKRQLQSMYKKTRKNGAPLECNKCNEWFCKEAFPEHQRDHKSTHTRVCIGCIEKRTCVACGRYMVKDKFTDGEWVHASYNDGRGRCKDCTERSSWGVWSCRGCKERKPKHEFSQWITNISGRANNATRCNTCRDNMKAAEQREQLKNISMIIPSSVSDPSARVHRRKEQSVCKSMVIIFCPEPNCHEAKEIDLNLLWYRHKDGHRFQNLCCLKCKAFARLGKWLRHLHSLDISIEAWLKQEKLFKCHQCPAHVTKLFYEERVKGEVRTLKRKITQDDVARAQKRPTIDREWKDAD